VKAGNCYCDIELGEVFTQQRRRSLRQQRMWKTGAGILFLLSPWLEPLILKAPESVAASGKPSSVRKDNSTFWERLSMATFTKWTRLYRSLGPGQGEVVLLVHRLSPRVRGDSHWTAVRPDRSIITVNTRDRGKLTTRRVAATNYANFPVMTRAEKQAADQTSKDLVTTAAAERDRRSQGSMMSYLRAARSLLGVLWAQRMWGTTAAMTFMAWRASAALGIWEWSWWLLERLDDAHEMKEGAAEYVEEIKVMWEEGKFELPILVGSVVLLGCLLFWRQLYSMLPCLATPSNSPAPSDVDSDGTAGHEAESSEDEKESLKLLVNALASEVDGMKAKKKQERQDRSSSSSEEERRRRGRRKRQPAEMQTQESQSGSEAVSENAMSNQVDRMISRLVQFEDAVKADRTGPKKVAESSSMQPPSPHIDLGRQSTAAGSMHVNISTPPGSPPASTPGDLAAAASPASSSWVDVSHLRDSLRDPKARLLETLERGSTRKSTGLFQQVWRREWPRSLWCRSMPSTAASMPLRRPG
jgi:hypothetical protein